MTHAADTVTFGPLRLKLGVEAGIEYRDNYNNSATNPESNFYWTFGPIIQGQFAFPLRFRWQGEEELTLSTSFAYQHKYSFKKKDETTFIAPIAIGLRLPLYAGPWLIEAIDTFTFSNEPLESQITVNTEQMVQYSNTATLSGTRRFGRFVLNLQTQRMDKWSPDTPGNDETVYTFSAIPSYYLNETISLFWNNSIGFIFPENKKLVSGGVEMDNRSDGVNVTSMVGVSGQITPVISGSVGGGIVHSQFGAVGTNSPPQSFTGVSGMANLSYAHPLRPNTTHSIGGYYSPSITAMLNRSNFQTSYGVHYQVSHRLNRNMIISSDIGWVHTQDISYGGSKEQNDLIAVGLALSRSLSKHLSANFRYRYQTRMSNLPGGSYDANQINFGLRYMF